MRISPRRRIVTGIVLGVTVFAALATGPVAPASAVPHWAQSSAHLSEPVRPLDGFAITHLPAGLGSPSDFEYEWEDVSFHSRVWETGPDPEGATKVDLTVKTVRGAGITDLEALRTFLTEYHEKDPADWKLTAVQVGPYSGYTVDNQVFWFLSPGLAAEVSIDRDRFTEDDLLQTAAGFRPETSA
ncbi:hypothetical protein OG394_36490 [Kribbella sp. NBC_01245]|uniref:hypothetical protein n=1 Tax=Kribbella sp. NBC_01245 TaxID=2903578 RepID=UPI002E2C3DD1|nr:hypothetical protein [Kribbella sp. NBC_01245]